VCQKPTSTLGLPSSTTGVSLLTMRNARAPQPAWCS
jgi:hypothetical protein